MAVKAPVRATTTRTPAPTPVRAPTVSAPTVKAAPIYNAPAVRTPMTTPAPVRTANPFVNSVVSRPGVQAQPQPTLNQNVSTILQQQQAARAAVQQQQQAQAQAAAQAQQAQMAQRQQAAQQQAAQAQLAQQSALQAHLDQQRAAAQKPVIAPPAQQPQKRIEPPAQQQQPIANPGNHLMPGDPGYQAPQLRPDLQPAQPPVNQQPVTPAPAPEMRGSLFDMPRSATYSDPIIRQPNLNAPLSEGSQIQAPTQPAPVTQTMPTLGPGGGPTPVPLTEYYKTLTPDQKQMISNGYYLSGEPMSAESRQQALQALNQASMQQPAPTQQAPGQINYGSLHTFHALTGLPQYDYGTDDQGNMYNPQGQLITPGSDLYNQIRSNEQTFRDAAQKDPTYGTILPGGLQFENHGGLQQQPVQQPVQEPGVLVGGGPPSESDMINNWISGEKYLNNPPPGFPGGGQMVGGPSGEQAAQSGMMALQNMPMPPGVASSMTPPPAAPGTYTMPSTPVAQGYMPPSQAQTQNQIYPQSYNMDPNAALMGAGGASAGINGGAAMNGLYRGI